MRDPIILARQFRKFRRRFHFTQGELAKLLGNCREWVWDVEHARYKSIHPKTLRLFIALKERHESERRNKLCRPNKSFLLR